MTGLEPKERNLPCWISGFLEFAADAPAPDLYKKWGAFAAIGGALTRRVWISTHIGPIYPNMFVVLVGGSSTGKGPILDPVRDMWAAIQKKNNLDSNVGISLGPNSVSVKGLLDAFADPSAHKSFRLNGELYSFKTLIIAPEELGVFLHDCDVQTFGNIIELLNCKEVYEEKIRSRDKLTIKRPHLHIFGGAQPGVLSVVFPDKAFEMGLTSRIFFVYGEGITHKPIFRASKNRPEIKAALTEDLRKIAALRGPMSITPKAVDFIEEWWEDAVLNDEPTHPKLRGYYGKRQQHVLKLSMIWSVSQGDGLLLERSHIELAIRDLVELEAEMPRVFEAMPRDKSQAGEIDDTLVFMRKVEREEKKPVAASRIIRFLTTRVPTHQIFGILESMMNAGLIEEADPPVSVILVTTPKYYRVKR